MQLLERDCEFNELERRLHDAQAGCGKVVLLAGEAGVGKSSLVEAFVQRHQTAVQALWGTCDALSTPRALGPVHEIAAQVPANRLPSQGDYASRERLFRSLLQEFSHADRASVVVLEDLHWADEATLDFVRYLARRIQRTHCLLIATYRDDEVGAVHPVRATLGELGGNHVARIRLTPLSPAACGKLAEGSGRDPALVYDITGGNPFFLREVLASPGDNVPESVRDAIIARLGRCSGGARAVAEFVSLVPGKMESWLVASVFGPVQQGAVDECIDRGLLQPHGNAFAFRHELARLAVNSTIPRARARNWHSKILRALTERGADGANLVHHALLADDAEAILRYAPLAGKEASRLGAHHEAAAHFATALKHCSVLPSAEQAAIYEQHAQESAIGNEITGTITSATRALALWRELGNTAAQARTLHIMSRMHWQRGNTAQADQAVADAIAILEREPPGAALGMAYSARSQLAMVCGRCSEALEFGERALTLARQFGDFATEAHALNNIGATLFADTSGKAFGLLEQSLAIALTHNLHEHAARAYTNLFTYCLMRHELDRAARLLNEGLAFCEEHHVRLHSLYMRAHATRWQLERGNWDEAASIANSLMRYSDLTEVQQIPTLVSLALVRARRGDPGVDPLLDRALELALPIGGLQRIGRVAAARAEHAWYRGDLERVAREAALGLQHAHGHDDPWIKGELVFWQARACPTAEIPYDIAGPYRHTLAGDWQAAAREWGNSGMPYDRALALAQGPEEALREALPILESLGAGPLAAIVRRRLRDLGARNVPRGPTAATARNPAGLTVREMEVLALLVEGCTNSQLARRLHLSTKTAGHHVSAILDKLGVRSRAEAVANAFTMGIVRAQQQSQSG